MSSVIGLTSLFSNQKEPTGITPAEAAKFTISYDYSTQVLSLTKISDWFYYFNGTKVDITTTLTAAAHANAYGAYFYYFDDSSGTLKSSSTMYDIPSTAQVAYVIYNPTATDAIKGIAFKETHGLQMDGETHEYLHNTRGAIYFSGGDITGYTPNTDTVAATSYAISACTFYDEDLDITSTALVDGGPYVYMWQTAAGQWDWQTGSATPYNIASNNITYNPSGSALVQVTGNSEWINMYPCVTNAVSATFQNLVLVGKSK